jgi:hypothetical protein
MRKSYFLGVFATLFALSPFASAQYFPETGQAALYQRSLDTRSRLNVLSISLQPGYEDLAALAYFRFARGARVLSSYVTNGEGGESDVRGEYPMQLAAIRRQEASKALDVLGSAEYFLNLPDVPAAADTGFVRTKWNADTLRIRLMNLISDFKPDIILVSRDWGRGDMSPQLQVLRRELLASVRRLNPPGADQKKSSSGLIPPWSVAGVWLDRGKSSGVGIPIDAVHPIWKKSYRAIGEEAAGAYASLVVQRNLWLKRLLGTSESRGENFYELAYPSGAAKRKTVDQNMPLAVTPALAQLERDVQTLTSTTMKGGEALLSKGKTSSGVLQRLSAVMESLDKLLSQPLALSSQERKVVLQWKLGFENLRLTLLGVTMQFTLDPTILTEKQVTILQIDTVTGMSGDGVYQLYFPATDQGWAINESMQRSMPLELHKPYRLLTPSKLEYNLPEELYGLARSAISKPFVFFVIHQSSKRENNFIYRAEIPTMFAPRFTSEAMTPIVRMVPSERVVIRLTNHSRDGVRDFVYVDDTLAVSTKGQFHLRVKDVPFQDTLTLTWKQAPKEGSYAVTYKIGREVVGRFAARQFEAHIDTSKTVALLAGTEGSPSADALRRLGANWALVSPDANLVNSLKTVRVLIIDRRALTFHKGLRSRKAEIEGFVRNGGHVIVLAQDAEVWNASPLLDNVTLSAVTKYDDEAAIETDNTHRLLTYPNAIRSTDWSEWLYCKAYNEVSGPALLQAATPVKAVKGRTPLVATWKIGAGSFTYSDLAFLPQFLNVHPGAYRLLANLISN